MSEDQKVPVGRPAEARLIGLAVSAALLLGLSVWGFALWLTSDDPDPHKLLTALGTAGLTLAFVGVLGGMVALAFKEWERRRNNIAAEQAFYRSILDDLKTVHDIVERAKLLIEAHKSAKTYGEQMRLLPDADITLHNIRRALRPSYQDVLDDIEEPLYACSSFIQGLTEEFRSTYKDISDAQSRDEAINEKLRKDLAEGKKESKDITFATKGWQMIQSLDALKILREEERWEEYYLAFRWHIDAASFHIRKRLTGGNAAKADEQLKELKKKCSEARAKVEAEAEDA